jgi:hypothetical protein
MPQYANETPIDVDQAVNLLTGKTARPETPAGSPADWLNRRFPRLGFLSGMQVLILGLLALANCCILALLATFLLSG